MLASLRTTLNELGLLNAILYWSDRLISRCTRGNLRIRRYAFVVQPLEESRQRRVKSDAALLVRPFKVDDPAQKDFPVPSEVVRRRLEQGSTCLIAELNGQFAGYIWLHIGPYPEDEVSCVFEPMPAHRVSWDFDVYVVPHLRLTRTFVRLWEAAGHVLRARGFTHSASRISTYNSASMRSHLRAGASVVGTAVFLTIGKWQLTLAPREFLGSACVTWRERPHMRISSSCGDG